jgi:hypothetical protein
MRNLAIALTVCLAGQVTAQNRIQFPTMSQTPSTVAPPLNIPQTTIPPNIGPLPQTQLPPGSAGASPWVPVPSSATLGQQVQPFDPYSNNSGGPSFGPTAGPTVAPFTPVPGQVVAPTYQPPASNQPFLPPTGTTYVPPNIVGPSPTLPGSGWQPVAPAAVIPPAFGQPPPTTPFGSPAIGAPVIGGPGFGGPPPPLNAPLGTTPRSIIPAPVFPEGLPWTRGQERLFQDTGALYTYLYGDDGDDLAIHDVELFTSAVFKNFAYSPNGLRVTPGFIFHFLDGPNVPAVLPSPPGRPEGIKLPSQLYSAYVDALWQPQITPQFSADLNVRVGVYSDFQEFNGDTLRFPSRALGVLQVTPSTAIKLGVEYFDRVDVKLLPAGGILWTPDENTRWDIYFPRPKLAKYLTTNGNTEMWWYLGGEYGGGSWTMEREADAMVDPGGRERIDINDIRVFVGIDWNNLDRFNGLFEIGYAFQREIVVRNHPTENVDPDDTFMLRAGLRF